ncbi:MAG: family 43 glycosylhydrolase [Opitutaceae bacterium]
MNLTRVLPLGLIAAFSLRAQPAPTFTDVTVHDPSVVKDGATYWVFGSHMAAAYSTDLMHWTQVGSSPTSSPLINNGTPQIEFAEGLTYASASTFWAPDVAKLSDGNFYYYYCMCQGSSPQSALGLAVSSAIGGPYVNDGLLLKSLGTSPTVTPYNANTMPNVVDPNVFYDKEGRLWMMYGSYSGGIFILELENDPASANFGRPKSAGSYGKKITGGNHARIEGSYVVYSPQTSFYYLFLSFGGLGAEDGTYNMRVFRSANPDGPYVDASGFDITTLTGAITDDSLISPYGVKLLGNIQFLTAPGDRTTTSSGYVCPGHNSAFFDSAADKYFLFFHTRFPSTTNPPNQGHQVRVHQLYLNADGWFVVAPHRYAGETLAATDRAGLLGDFKVVVQSKAMPKTTVSGGTATIPMNTSAVVTFHHDGSITGAHTGTWALSGAHDATIILGGVSYRGVYSTQWDNDNQAWVPCFSALSTGATAGAAGVSLLGSKVSAAPVAPAIARQPSNLTAAVGGTVVFDPGVTGTFAPDVQWYKDGVPLAGANAGTLTLSNLSAANAGNYHFTAINAAGSVTSATATLLVGNGGELAAQTVVSGHDVSLVTHTAGPIQWQVSSDGGTTWRDVANTAPYSGATTDTLTITNAGSSLNNYRYRAVSGPAGSTVAGNSVTLTVAAAVFSSPVSLAFDSGGNLFVSDNTAHTIHKVTTANVATPFAGSSGAQGSADGSGTAATFRQPTGIAIDAANNLYVADTGNSTLRKITAAGAVTTLAGSPSNSGSTDGSGAASRFASPVDLAVKTDGSVYVADTGNHTVRSVTSAGTVATLAGTAGASGSADGPGAAARFNAPKGLGIDTGGTLYVADTTNNTVRAVTTGGGATTTHAGIYGIAGSADGAAGTATFSGPTGMVIATNGDIYIADTQNNTIRKIAASGAVSTVAGLPGVAGLKDGTGADAWFNQPRDVALDGAGNLYVADTGNATLRKVALTSGLVTTLNISIGGSTGGGGSGGGSTGGGGTGGGSTGGGSSGGGSAGGGGALGPCFVGLLLLLGSLRRAVRR